MSETLVLMRGLEERFVAWARAKEDIRAALVVGSWARADHPADEWSDLDIGFSTTDPQQYLRYSDWLNEIGKVWLMYPDPIGVTRHVLFDGGLDAGLAPLPHNSIKMALRVIPVLRRLPFLKRLLPGGLGKRIEQELAQAAEYYRRGARIILDKDGVAAKFLAMLPAEPSSRRLPSERVYLETVHQFWFEAIWTAKHLRRGELWHAKCGSSDGRMKELLLRMMEWHALATHGPDFDTWENGRFLEEWGDRRVLDELPRAFARYDEDDTWRALIVTMDLFRWLARETGQRLGYVYPAEADGHVSAWVKNCSEGRGAPAG